MGQTVRIGGNEVPIASDMTIVEFIEEYNIDCSDFVLTYRSEDGIESLKDNDVIAGHVDDGQEVTPQPLATTNPIGHK